MALVFSMAMAAQAQDAPAPQDKPAEGEQERSTGLPSRVTWTFNFDAGWGNFGFGNSLFNNPKEPGVDENLSDQWTKTLPTRSTHTLSGR